MLGSNPELRRKPGLRGKSRGLSLLGGAFGALLFLAACEEQNTYAPPPPPTVTVAQPLIRDVTEYLEFSGTTAAYARVEIPARVPGVLQAVHFEIGSEVSKGDLLFTIDPQEYDASVQATEAELARAQAVLSEAEKTLGRARTLIQRGNISQASLDEAEANYLSAEAEVLVREANLTSARIDLGYTQVTAPMSGRVGRNLVDVGNLVGQGSATVLTDITVYDPIHVYFEVNERDLLRAIERIRSQIGEGGSARDQANFPIEVGLTTEEGYPHVGVTDFTESQVDPNTGTLQVRGVLENPGKQPALLPGLFTRVRVPIAERAAMPLVSENAVGFDQSGRYLLVVNDEGIVEKRTVTLGQLVEGLRVIERGIDPSDRVIVTGVQRAREGIAVQAEEIDMMSLLLSANGASASETGRRGDGQRATGDSPGAAPDAATD
ncbi:efflux RND transporter periplasmic adaptor subunit [Algihabitans albus]|uniref:efflux RND transporter periplasmic adaptor subunit n=1 Tax=Algihabitans albus TaxID=2164067 RepID=UPI000E5CFFF4|nr:efflux RND transporter periplasmic adaptor subunit [Algihabitans albus]